MADQPPDPSAHAQVHDWAEERGLQTVDLITAFPLVCPACHRAREHRREWVSGGPVYLVVSPCDCGAPACRIKQDHLIQRFPCEVLPPDPTRATEMPYRIGDEVMAMDGDYNWRSARVTAIGSGEWPVEVEYTDGHPGISVGRQEAARVYKREHHIRPTHRPLHILPVREVQPAT